MRCCSCLVGHSVTVVAVAYREVTTKTDSRLAARCAAIASLGAGVVHFAVMPMHWREWLPAGVFFASLATFQLIWAFVAWSRPATLVLAAGIAANVGAAGLWVMSCITGPPFGPSAGEPEAVGAAGISVLLLQCYVVMGSVWAWSRKYQSEEVSAFGRAVVLMGANTIMAGAVTVGLVAGLQGHHHHHHGGALEAQAEHHGAHEEPMEGHSHDAHMDADMHMDGDAHVDGDTHADGVPQPATAEHGEPVTDMALDADGDHSPAETSAGAASSEVEAKQPANAAPSAAVTAGTAPSAAPAAQPVPAPAVAPTPAAAVPAPSSPSPHVDDADSDTGTDGHQHHHDD